MKKSATTKSASPSRRIDARIEELNDWRGEVLARVRALIKQAVPGVVEEWKWRGVPVWYHDGQICTGETYKRVVKLTFLKGASLKDPAKLFNASLEGNARRAIDLHEDDAIDESACTMTPASNRNRLHVPFITTASPWVPAHLCAPALAPGVHRHTLKIRTLWNARIRLSDFALVDGNFAKGLANPGEFL